MKKHDLISEETHQQLIVKNDEYKEQLYIINDALETEKLQKMEEDVESIDQKINDWSTRMAKLLEEQQ